MEGNQAVMAFAEVTSEGKLSENSRGILHGNVENTAAEGPFREMLGRYSEALDLPPAELKEAIKLIMQNCYEMPP